MNLSKIGAILLSENLITEDQLKKAIDIQKEKVEGWVLSLSSWALSMSRRLLNF